MKTTYITLPKRENTPETRLYLKLFAQNDELGSRDVVILLPGGPGNNLAVYEEPYSFSKLLFPYVDVILFDPRGCGKSDSAAVEHCSLDHYIDDIEAIRQGLNISPDRFIVFGQSYGSFAGVGYAARYPNNLKKLILIGGAVTSDFLNHAKENLKKIGTPEQIKEAECLWEGRFNRNFEEMSAFYRVMAPLYSSAYEPNDELTTIESNIDILNYGWSNFLRKIDFSRELKNVVCPVFMFWGEDDWMLDLKQARLIQSLVPQCELEVYKNCGHLLWVDDWGRFSNKLVEVIEGK